MSIEFADGITKLIGFYTIHGPQGRIEGKRRDEVLRFSTKLIRSWPNTIAKKPYRDNKGNWIIKVKTKETNASRCAPSSIPRALDSVKAED